MFHLKKKKSLLCKSCFKKKKKKTPKFLVLKKIRLNNDIDFVKKKMS
jgi:hypothetical protein